jgi:3'-5' exoribonuclease
MKYINEFVERDKLENIYLLIVNVTKGVSNAGSPYLSLSLQDKTGTIEGKRWEVSPEETSLAEIGKVVCLNAEVIDYRGANQLKIITISEVNQNEVEYERFCLPSPVPQDVLINKLNNYIANIKDSSCHTIVEKIITKHYKEFVTYPAASRNHHEFMSGLLYHTISMADFASLIASYYGNLDEDILISGVLLHDVGKVIELSGPIATKYTTTGKLLGHISIIQAQIREIADQEHITNEVPTLLEHMILSHHGSKEFGSPVLPLTREALVLHFVDDLDSKMNILDKAYLGVEEGEWTQRIIAMDGRSFYKPLKRK